MMSRVDEVVRAHFNRAAPHKLTREGGERHEEASRASILSTGEVVPHGHSLRTRMIHLHIERRLEADLNALSAKASDGELAAFMAAFLRWLAPKVGALRPRLPELARAAAQRCGFEGEDRTRHLLGDLMLGIEYLADFLEPRASSRTKASTPCARGPGTRCVRSRNTSSRPPRKKTPPSASSSS